MKGKECVLIIFLLVITSSTLAGRRARRAADPAECTNLEDCNRLWRHGEAYECSERKCKCHPQAFFDQKNKDCKCNEGYEKRGNNCFALPVLPPPPPNGSEIRSDPTSRALGSCNSDAQCPQNSKCINTKCNCENAYIMILGSCVPVARNLGETCTENEICETLLGGFSKCDSGRCVCLPNAVPTNNNTTCILKKELGEPCTKPEQCDHILNATCNFDVCGCETGYVSFGGSCIRVVDNYNSSCNQSIQCQNGNLGYGSLCKRTELGTFLCRCETEYFYKQDMKKCLYAKGIGTDCDEKNTGCYLPADGDTQNIECKNGQCVCKNKYKASDDNKQCVSGTVVNHVSFFVLALSLILFTSRW